MICPDCATTLEIKHETPWCPNCDRYATPMPPLDLSVQTASFGDFTAERITLGFYDVIGPGNTTVGTIVPVGTYWASFRIRVLTDEFNVLYGEWHEPELLGLSRYLPYAVALFN